MIQTDPNVLEYARLKKEIKNLSEQAEMLQPTVMAKIQDELYQSDNPETATIKLDAGTFSITRRKQWTYSPDVVSAEQELKQKKKDEERSGAADYSIQEILVFKP